MKYIIFYAFIFYCIPSYSQFPEYCVYLVRGDVKVIKNSSIIKKIKQNDLIYRNEVIKVNKNSELQLVSKDGKYLVLDLAGSYRPADLSEKMKITNSNGWTKTYLQLVYQQILDPNYDFTKIKLDNIGSAYGATTRGINCNDLIFPISGLKTNMDSLHFLWRKKNSASIYNINIYNDWEELIYSDNIKDTQCIINLFEIFKGKHGTYSWNLKIENAECETSKNYFEWITKEEEDQFIASLIKGKQQLNIPGQLEIITKLEENGFILRALNLYLLIIDSNKEDIPLVKSYLAFLSKYGFENKQ